MESGSSGQAPDVSAEQCKQFAPVVMQYIQIFQALSDEEQGAYMSKLNGGSGNDHERFTHLFT